MAIKASKSSLSAIAFSATAISSAPGTVTCLMWRSATPSAANSYVQACAILSVRAALKRACTMPTTRPSPSSLSERPLSADCMRRSSVAVRDEAGHFEAVAGHARQAARAAEHAHARDAKVAQDLCANAVGAHVHRRLLAG